MNFSDHVILFFLIFLLTGCSGSQDQATPAEDTLYLTPIPQSTLDASVITPPATTRLQAVIAARKELSTTRLEFSSPPGVRLVEKLSLEEAIQRAGFPEDTANSQSAGSEVWLVIFEGEFQIIPPDPMHTFTPGAPGHGCAAVIIIASSALPAGAGTLDCPTSP